MVGESLDTGIIFNRFLICVIFPTYGVILTKVWTRSAAYRENLGRYQLRQNHVKSICCDMIK